MRDRFVFLRDPDARLGVEPDAVVKELARGCPGKFGKNPGDEGAFLFVQTGHAIQQQHADKADEADDDPEDLNDRGGQVEGDGQSDKDERRREEIQDDIRIAVSADHPGLQQGIRPQIKRDTAISDPVVNIFGDTVQHPLAPSGGYDLHPVYHFFEFWRRTGAPGLSSSATLTGDGRWRTLETGTGLLMHLIAEIC